MVLKKIISILKIQRGRRNCTNEVNDQCANGVEIAIFGCLIFIFFNCFFLLGSLTLHDFFFISIVLQLVGCNLFMYVGWI